MLKILLACTIVFACLTPSIAAAPPDRLDLDSPARPSKPNDVDTGCTPLERVLAILDDAMDAYGGMRVLLQSDKAQAFVDRYSASKGFETVPATVLIAYVGKSSVSLWAGQGIVICHTANASLAEFERILQEINK